MATQSKLLIIAGEQPQGIRKICLNDNGTRHYIALPHIIYLAGDQKSTTLYLTDPDEPHKLRTITVGYNLGYFEALTEHCFARINQKYIVRLEYVSTIDAAHTIKLSIKNHPLLVISDNWRKEFYRKLEK